MKFPAFEPIDLDSDVQSSEIVNLCLTKICSDKNQARKFFSDALLQELASSIRQHGIIQPILVTEIDKNKGEYQIIAGERRWLAAKIAGLEKMPAIIKKYDKANSMVVSLIENIQRENLNALEEAQAIQKLLKKCYLSHNEVAKILGKSRATITNLLRLLTLTDEVKEMLNKKLLEMGHARALLSLSSEHQINIAKIIITKSLSVRETEKLVQRLNTPENNQKIFSNHQFEQKKNHWMAQLSKKMLSKVNIHFTSDGKGRVVISFESLEEADWLMSHFTVV